MNPLNLFAEAASSLKDSVENVFDFDNQRIESPIVLVFPTDPSTKRFMKESEHIITKILDVYGKDSCTIFYSRYFSTSYNTVFDTRISFCQLVAYIRLLPVFISNLHVFFLRFF